MFVVVVFACFLLVVFKVLLVFSRFSLRVGRSKHWGQVQAVPSVRDVRGAAPAAKAPDATASSAAAELIAKAGDLATRSSFLIRPKKNENKEIPSLNRET